jgi:hypothetical protein
VIVWQGRGGATMPLKAEKKEVRVTIFTEQHKVEGTYHMVPDARFSDDLNARQKDFIPLTKASITDLHNSSGPPTATDFLAVNKHHIVLFLIQPPAA